MNLVPVRKIDNGYAPFGKWPFCNANLAREVWLRSAITDDPSVRKMRKSDHRLTGLPYNVFILRQGV